VTLIAEDSTSVKPPRDYSLTGRTLFQVPGLPNVQFVRLAWPWGLAPDGFVHGSHVQGTSPYPANDSPAEPKAWQRPSRDALSRARTEISCFSVDKDLHGFRLSARNPRDSVLDSLMESEVDSGWAGSGGIGAAFLFSDPRVSSMVRREGGGGWERSTLGTA
jgi:hypothetical protein